MSLAMYMKNSSEKMLAGNNALRPNLSLLDFGFPTWLLSVVLVSSSVKANIYTRNMSSHKNAHS